MGTDWGSDCRDTMGSFPQLEQVMLMGSEWGGRSTGRKSLYIFSCTDSKSTNDPVRSQSIIMLLPEVLCKSLIVKICHFTPKSCLLCFSLLHQI